MVNFVVKMFIFKKNLKKNVFLIPFLLIIILIKNGNFEHSKIKVSPSLILVHIENGMLDENVTLSV